MRFKVGDVVEYTRRPDIEADIKRHPNLPGQQLALLREQRRRKGRGRVATVRETRIMILWDSGRDCWYEDSDQRIQEVTDAVEG